MRSKYTPLTDSQWQYIEKKIGKPRKSEHSLREIINAILCLNYTGVQWRALDSSFPKWQTVYYHFRQFKLRGVWEDILNCLVEYKRKKDGKNESPSVLAIDSQSVKSIQFTSQEIGIDGNKKIKGRKRTIIVDRSGLVFAIKVTAANVSDNESGLAAIALLKGRVPRLKKISADHGYKNTFVSQTESLLGCKVEIKQKPESSQGFVPDKDRWQVERAFSFLNFRRRLFRDVEKTIESAEAMLQIAFISFIINVL
jgi:putative transposase